MRSRQQCVKYSFASEKASDLRFGQKFVRNALTSEKRQVCVCVRNAKVLGIRMDKACVCIRNASGIRLSRKIIRNTFAFQIRKVCVYVGKASGMRLRKKYDCVRNSHGSSRHLR